MLAGQEVAVRLPLPLVEIWEELQAEVERLTGEARLQILCAILQHRPVSSLFAGSLDPALALRGSV